MQGLEDFQNTSLVNSDNFQSTKDNLACKNAKDLPKDQQEEILLNEVANTNQEDQEISSIQNYDNSETLSLSFIQEEQRQLQLSESIQWEKELSQYGNLFQNGLNSKNYREMCKFEDIINHHNNLIIHKGFDSVISRGYSFQVKDWIVLKNQQVSIKQIKEAVNQYLIHDEIYRQYPDFFLKLIQPVYIEQIKQDFLVFTSQLEEGIVNLYDYSQQHKIQDLEFQLIFQQIYEQIQLLHKMNIAHRDIKPQNIIFVKNKGWLLCDFGDSLKYESVQGIYNIRGTYSFIQPNLQVLAQKVGISTKQNLHHNDLYALAITLLVIKFQIKNSDEITQYITMNKDPIIEALMQQNNDVEKLIIPNEFKFIEIQFDKNKQQQLTSQNSNSIEYYQALVDVLCCHNNIFPELPQEIIRDILNQIDYKLQLNDSEFFSFNIICIMQINHYAKELKNLLPLTFFRSSRFWKSFIFKLATRQIQKLRQQSFKELIGQLHSLGYIELTLNLAKLFLQNDYDFTVHIIVIILLKYLQQDEEAHYEYNQLLNNREYLYMNESEQLKFIHLVMYEFPDHQQSSDRIYIENHFDGLLYFSHLIMKVNTDEQLIINQYFQDLHKMINMRKTEEQVLIHYENSALQSLNFQINFIKQAIKSMKYCASIIYMQIFLCLHCEDLILLGNRKKLKKLVKRMNQNLLFSSESSTQMQVLTSLKFIVLLKSKINKKKRDSKVMNQLLQIIMKLDKIKFKFYRHVILEELSNQINYEYSLRNALKYFKLFICIYKRQYYTFIKNYQKKFFITIAFNFFNMTLNRKRYLETTKNEKGKFWHYIEPKTTQRLIHQKTCKTSRKQFLFQQYLERNN